MAAGPTYEPIATVTLGTAGVISFTSIPATYTDLRLVIVGTVSPSAPLRLRFNGDTGTNYSETDLFGDGSTVGSGRTTTQQFIQASGNNNWGSVVAMLTLDVFSYAGSTYKTTLATSSNDYNGSGFVARSVGLWRSTAAITTVATSTTMAIGTTATLYGIKAA